MTQLEKIDYMIQSLQIAKDEIEYAKAYMYKKDTDESLDKDFYSEFGKSHRTPNGTTIREALRMVGRMANQVANECTLTQYCEEIFRE